MVNCGLLSLKLLNILEMWALLLLDFIDNWNKGYCNVSKYFFVQYHKNEHISLNLSSLDKQISFLTTFIYFAVVKSKHYPNNIKWQWKTGFWIN